MEKRPAQATPETKGSGSPASPAAPAWAATLVRVDAAWQTLESRLCAAALVAEIVALTLWISLKGLSSDYQPGGNASGVVYRGVLAATALALIAQAATGRTAAARGGRANRIAVSAALVVGLVSGRLWAHAGVAWSSNVLNWLQNASALMLVGGLRGLVTRLTLWVALLGGSLATSRGKHIHIDVAVRAIPPRLRRGAAVAGWLAAAVVCAVGVAGFVDYIAIAEFRAPASEPCPGDSGKSCDTTASEKLATVKQSALADVFLVGRQLSLDARSVGRVVTGAPYDRWLTAAEWNAWLDGADWSAHFEKSAVDALHMDPSAPSATRMPQVAVPGTGEEARGLLIRDLNFVFPFGLAVIALKFLLRALLVVAGKVGVDPDAEMSDDAPGGGRDTGPDAGTAQA